MSAMSKPSMTISVEIRTDQPMALGYSLMPCMRVMFCSFSVAFLALSMVSAFVLFGSRSSPVDVRVDPA